MRPHPVAHGAAPRLPSCRRPRRGPGHGPVPGGFGVFGVGIVSIPFVLAAVDIASRPLLEKRLYYREFERYAIHSPDWIGLGRFEPNVAFRGRVSGDLAAKSGMPRRTAGDRVPNRRARVSQRRPRPVQTRPGGRPRRFFRPRNRDLAARHLAVPSRDPLRPARLQPLLSGLALGRAHEPEDRAAAHLDDNATVVLGPSTRATISTTITATDSNRSPSGPGWRCRVRWTTFQNRSPIRQLIFRIRRIHRVRRCEADPVRTLPDGASVLFYRSTIEAAQRTREEVLAHPHLAPLTRTFAEMARYAGAEGVSSRGAHAPDQGPDLCRSSTAGNRLEALSYRLPPGRVRSRGRTALGAESARVPPLGFPLWTAAGRSRFRRTTLFCGRRRHAGTRTVLGNSALADAVYQGVLRPGWPRTSGRIDDHRCRPPQAPISPCRRRPAAEFRVRFRPYSHARPRSCPAARRPASTR